MNILVLEQHLLRNRNFKGIRQTGCKPLFAACNAEKLEKVRKDLGIRSVGHRVCVT